VPQDTVLVIDDSPTILKVVQLVLTKAGFKVLTAADGEEGIRRARESRPALILLDFVMPKMNGYQVCRALGESGDLKDVPVVLMSAKGDQVGERFVKVMGIVDYITKPFSPEAITAVVTHTIGKYSNGRGVEVPPVDAAEVIDEDTPHREPTSPRAALAIGGSAERRLDALAALREGLVDALVSENDSHDFETVLRRKLDDTVLMRLLDPVSRTLAPGGDDSASLRGNLQQVPLAEVLGLLQQQRQWGTLSVARSSQEVGQDSRSLGALPAKIDVYFKQGKVELTLAEGLGEEFLVGRYLVDQQAISRQDLELFLKSRGPVKPAQKPMGEQLLKLSYITEEELKQALARQTSERIYELLRWPAGRFAFTASRELPPLAIDAALGLDIDGILMEGVRRVDEWHLIEREVDDFDMVFLRNEEQVQNVGKARLTREELSILELVNGKHSVKDIVRQSRMGSFEVSKMLFRLLSIKLIRRRVAPVAV
jgi:DNA-binding response OmpR family regulator